MNRTWHLSSVLLLAIAQVVVGSRFVQAADKIAGEALLPKDTLVYFSIANIPEFKAKWEKSSMGQMLRDPALKPFLEDVEKKIEEGSKKLDEEIGVSLNELAELPHGQLMIAILEKPARKFSGVLALEFGESKATINKLLKKMDEQLEKEEAEHTTEDVNKVTVHLYKLKSPEPDNPFKTIAYFTTDSYLVVSTELDALKEVIERWDGNSDDTLAQNEQFKYIQTVCKFEGGDPLLKWYVSPIGLIQSGIAVAQSSFPQAGMAGAFLPMLGIDAFKGWGGAMDLDEGEFEGVVHSFVYAENARGIMGLFQFPEAQLAPPKWVPAEVGSYAVLNWNILGAYTSVETLVDSFQGRGATARYLDSVAEQGPMIHPKKDVIDHLDGKIHLLQADPGDSEDGAPPTPQILFGFGLKDSAKMKKTLAAAAKAGNSNLETRDFNGETIYEVSTPAGDQVFSFAVTEGQLIATNDTPLLEGVMRGQSGRTPLVDSDEYKRIAKYFPSKTSMLSFQRSDVQLKASYNLLKNADTFIEGLDVSKLPPFEVIAKYLQPSGGYTVPDKKGAKSVTFSLKRAD